MDEVIKRRIEIGFELALFLFFAVFFIVGLSYPPRPVLFPLVIEGIGSIAVLAQLIITIRKKVNPVQMASSKVNWRKVLLSYGMLLISLVVTYFFGGVLSSAFIVFFGGLALGAKNKVKLAIVAVATVVVVYIIFVRIMGAPIYDGVLFG